MNVGRRPGTDAAWFLLASRGCQQITDAGLAQLATIPGLQRLDLS